MSAYQRARSIFWIVLVVSLLLYCYLYLREKNEYLDSHISELRNLYFTSADNETESPLIILPINISNNSIVFNQIPEFTSVDNVTGFPYMIVPDIVHMVHFGEPQLRFREVIVIKAAYQNHRPDRMVIHCDCHNMSGECWDLVKDIESLEIAYKEKPEYIFGKKLNYIEHASDVARLEILMKYGGIYLDSDMYIVGSLDEYRKFEFTVGWPIGENMGNQILIAHGNARFLKMYYDSYHDYRSDLWYYNGGQLPTKSILYKQPHLVHRVLVNFFVENEDVSMLYSRRTEEWRDYDAVHLYLRKVQHLKFDMQTVKTFDNNFGDMARLVLFGSTDIIQN